MKKEQESRNKLSSTHVILLAVACGLAVANVYYAQPLLDTMGATFRIDHAEVGIIVTVSQIGYGIGLLLLVPLGDLVDGRKLILFQFLLLGSFLFITGLATSVYMLLAGMFLVGLMAVVTQALVAYAANMANDRTRGRVVGTVTGGVVIGLLLARTVAGGLTQLAGWRSVYLISAMMVMAMSIILFRTLPASSKPKNAVSYPRLLRSIFVLFRKNPLFLVRSLMAMLIFAAGQVLWTPMVLPLSQPPFSLSHTAIGMLGLAGATGAVGAAKAGSLSDRGHAGWASGIALVLMLISWLPMALMFHSLWLLILGIIIFDMGLQAVHVTNQSLILKIDPEARSRITGGYMIFYAIGSATGSIASTMTFAHWGWNGVCILGAVIGAMAFLLWWWSEQSGFTKNK
ncbi:MFS transporter [Sinomicrobium weinanense]|uniref:MFS transporter n=1 Tax=Sinomicrobium weinanense TaxID=2842200 RepID=A0A926JNG7_9FLAO|nr:MFS transporter [Sinomicrobium weinanense]MBC9794446.1 MFS transporter [Sinomicrobium weinanense]MBU3124353.1 MFS transporter [Sinomicrobium weinanense]